jgi:hypothetical protein
LNRRGGHERLASVDTPPRRDLREMEQGCIAGIGAGILTFFLALLFGAGLGIALVLGIVMIPMATILMGMVS